MNLNLTGTKCITEPECSKNKLTREIPLELRLPNNREEIAENLIRLYFDQKKIPLYQFSRRKDNPTTLEIVIQNVSFHEPDAQVLDTKALIDSALNIREFAERVRTTQESFVKQRSQDDLAIQARALGLELHEN